jgi:lysyl-tRNA synthetase class 2
MEERLKKIANLKEMRINPYPYRFDRTHSFAEIKEQFEVLSNSSVVVSTCGRIHAVRGHGKTIFATLADENERMQIYLRSDEMGERFNLFDNCDIGDIVGVTGKVFKTKTGEITVLVGSLAILSKSLRPLPEKWHGLKDVEIRFRKRYVDLIANQDVRGIFKGRTKIVSLVRAFFDDRGFMEVETPVLQPIYGGAAAKPFRTFYNALDQDMYLRIADELYLKRLIVGGYEKVWEFCRDFRNEGLDRFHNPEFTMVEAYQAYTDYEGIMELIEDLMDFLVQKIMPDRNIVFQERSVHLKRPFKRLKYVDALNERIGFDILKATAGDVKRACEKHGIKPEALSSGAMIDKLFSELVQKEILEPTFVIDYPKVISPLAKEHRCDPGVVERFELVMFGIELVNAFSELNDPIEQRKRFEEQLAHSEEGIGAIDEDFIEALEYGMPPTGGLGIGIDRLCMVLLNQPSLREVILFPQLKKET